MIRYYCDVCGKDLTKVEENLKYWCYVNLGMTDKKRHESDKSYKLCKKCYRKLKRYLEGHQNAIKVKHSEIEQENEEEEE